MAAVEHAATFDRKRLRRSGGLSSVHSLAVLEHPQLGGIGRTISTLSGDAQEYRGCTERLEGSTSC